MGRLSWTRPPGLSPTHYSGGHSRLQSQPRPFPCRSMSAAPLVRCNAIHRNLIRRKPRAADRCQSKLAPDVPLRFAGRTFPCGDAKVDTGCLNRDSNRRSNCSAADPSTRVEGFEFAKHQVDSVLAAPTAPQTQRRVRSSGNTKTPSPPVPPSAPSSILFHFSILLLSSIFLFDLSIFNPTFPSFFSIPSHFIFSLAPADNRHPLPSSARSGFLSPHIPFRRDRKMVTRNVAEALRPVKADTNIEGAGGSGRQ